VSQAVPSNVAASVKQRLLNRAREQKEDFNLLPVNEPPTALTEDFYADATKMAQWNAFNLKNKLYIQPSSLESVMTSIREFVMPLMRPEIMSGERHLQWESSKAWTAVKSDGRDT
jgi:hypothetical protein